MAASTRQRSGRARSRSTRSRGGGVRRAGTWTWRPGKRTRRRASIWRSVASLARPFALSQTQRDVLGLALCALGIFMAFVLYWGWDGGGVGHGLATGLGFSVGRARWIAPPALLLIGAVLLLRPAFPELRPLRAGALCLFAAVVLALADGTLGISPGPAQAVTEGAVHAGPHAHAGGASQWSPAYMEARGGIAGQGLWWVTHGLVQGVGVEILVAFLTARRALAADGRLARGDGARGGITAAGARACSRAAGGCAPRAPPRPRPRVCRGDGCDARLRRALRRAGDGWRAGRAGGAAGDGAGLAL